MNLALGNIVARDIALRKMAHAVDDHFVAPNFKECPVRDFAAHAVVQLANSRFKHRALASKAAAVSPMGQ
jgi:hypothetical protein